MGIILSKDLTINPFSLAVAQIFLESTGSSVLHYFHFQIYRHKQTLSSYF